MRYKSASTIRSLVSRAFPTYTTWSASPLAVEENVLDTSRALALGSSRGDLASQCDKFRKQTFRGLGTTAVAGKSWRVLRGDSFVPNENIVIDNLEATIEAHRVYNAGPRIRRVWSEVGGGHPTQLSKDDWSSRLEVRREKTPNELPNSTTTKPKPSVSAELKEHWPRGSPKFKKITGEKGSLEKDEICDYEPHVFEPRGPFSIRGSSELSDSPWKSLIMLQGGDGFARLNAEILAFESWMRLDQSEQRASSLIKTKIAKYVQRAVCEGRLQLIGSYGTGLETPLSDMDFTIVLPKFEKDPSQRGPSPTRPKAQKARLKALWACKSMLEGKPQLWRDVELVWATIPVIVATHRESRITIQLQQQHGSSSAFLGSMAFGAFQSEFPSLRPIYILLKAALAVRGLDKTFDGGLSSYPLLIAIVNALKHCEYRYHRNDVAMHLLFVLRFYIDCDLYTTGFRLDHPRVFPKLGGAASQSESGEQPEDHAFDGMLQVAKTNPRQPYLLCLQDPLNAGNDLGKRAYAIKHIRALFQVALTEIEASVDRWGSLSPNERQHPKDLMLDVLIKADYEAMMKDRTQRRCYAERVSMLSR